MSSSTAAYGGVHGGAGGKFPKKPLLKSHPKPYDRPSQPTNNRNNNNNNNDNNGWLTKIIDAPHKLYSFVFGDQRRLDEHKANQDVQPETVANVVDSATNLPVDCGGMDHDGCGAAELEDRLKQKVFTRSEVDQLSALLLSRTNENLDGAEKGMSGTKLSDLQAVPTSRDKLSTLSAHENNIKRALSGTISTPDVKFKVLQGDVASPAEIAKAYMAGRPAVVSPSVLRLHNQSLDEEVATPSNSLSRSISPAVYLNQKAASYIGTSSNGFMTPRFRGRSIIHNTARTPYSRVHPLMSSKAAETNFCIGGPSYHNVTENSHYTKRAIKRRRSVLENDIGSVGPIRRIRQKSYLLHPKTLSLPPPGGRQETHVTGVLSDFSEVSHSVEHGFQNRSSLPGTSSRFVPSQSIEMAQKIFEHLDKFSPKVMKKPGPESVESLKCSPSSQDMKKTKKSLDYGREQNNATTETSQIAEEVSAKKFTTSSASLGPPYGNGSKNVVSYPSNKSKAGEYMMPLSIGDRPLEKQAFQMSSDELCQKLDDNVPSKEVALSTSLIEAKQYLESSTKSLAIPDILPLDQTVAVEKAPEMKPTAQLGKTDLESVAHGCSPSETIVSSPVLPASPANVSMFDVISVPQSTLQSDEVAQQMEKRNFAIVYSSKSDNLPTAINTPPVKDVKSEILVSTIKVAAQVNVPATTVNMNTPVFGDAVFKSGDPPVEATSSVLDAKLSALSSGGNALFSLSAPTFESTDGDVQSAGIVTVNKHTLSFETGSAPVSVFAPSFLGGSTSSMPFLGSSGSTGLSLGNPFSSKPLTASNSLSNPFTTPLASTSISTTSSISTVGLGSSGDTTSTFIFGATSSPSASNNAAFIFGGSSGLTASSSAIPSAFGIGSSQPSVFVSTTCSTNDQITMEDTMAEDSPQHKAPLVPSGGFGSNMQQTPVAPQNSLFQPPGGFGFNAQQTPVVPQNFLFQPPGGFSGGFGFNAQQSPVVPQNSLFQPSGSSVFNAGTTTSPTGTFSIGTSTDKSQRRIFKPKKGSKRK